MRRALLVITVAGLTVAAAVAGTLNAAPEGSLQVIHRGTQVAGVSPTGDQDAIPEPGEQFSLRVELRNVGPVPATGITANLQPAGFTLQQGTSAYPDLQPGASAQNSTPFVGTLPAGAPCGFAYITRLQVNTQEGSFSVPVVVPVSTGQPRSASWTSNTPVPIPDNATVESTISVPASETDRILDLNVRINNVSHTWVGDLLVSLRRPGSALDIDLIQYRGSGANFVGTVLDDEADASLAGGTVPFTGSFIPDSLTEMLASVDGHVVGGDWKLRIFDNATDDTGQLNSWSIDATVARCNRAPQASFRRGPYATLLAGLPTTFTAASVDAGGQIAGHAWDFDNDGEFDDGSATTVRWTYPSVGTATVRLRSIDSEGNAGVMSVALPVLRPCRVPRVVGKKVRAAQAAIRAANCRVGRVRRARSRRVGRVIRQTPRAGIRGGRGTRVNLVVGRR